MLVQTRSEMEGRSISFLDFPVEIRNEIYQLALNERTVLLRRWFFKDEIVIVGGLREPALLAVCRQIRAEATQVLYVNTTFEANHSVHAQAFLQLLGPERSRMLKTLRAYNSEVVLGCTNYGGWLDTVLRITRRLLRSYPAQFHKDALLVPVKEEPEVNRNVKQKAKIVWKRFCDVEEFKIIGKDFEWSIWSKESWK